MFAAFRLAASLGVGLILTLAAHADGPAKKPAKAIIDLAICLDTSNSMDGLIGSAKARLWDIVNDLARAKPTPQLRVALFSYGNNGYDPKTGWVKKDLDFTTDLDKVNEKLFGLKTYGGEEYVARVSLAAMDQLQWCQEKSALKLMFVCGNEPANQDRTLDLKQLAEKAVRSGIIINTIYCGPASSPESGLWRDFAVLSEGKYANIDQGRGAVVIATPYDKDLAVLSQKINHTYVFFGKNAKELSLNQIRQDANAAQQGAGVAAGRAVSKGTELYRFEEHDLVEKLKADPKFDVKKVPVEELCDELKKLKPEQREQRVREQLGERQKLQKQIAELGKKRESYLSEERKKQGDKSEKALDEAVRIMLREQSQRKGIEIPK